VETINASAIIACCCIWAPADGAASFFLSPHEIFTELKIKKNITESSLKLFTIVQLYLGVVKISTYLRLSINLTTHDLKSFGSQKFNCLTVMNGFFRG
jgi:hypothetical protein